MTDAGVESDVDVVGDLGSRAQGRSAERVSEKRCGPVSGSVSRTGDYTPATRSAASTRAALKGTPAGARVPTIRLAGRTRYNLPDRIARRQAGAMSCARASRYRSRDHHLRRLDDRDRVVPASQLQRLHGVSRDHRRQPLIADTQSDLGEQAVDPTSSMNP